MMGFLKSCYFETNVIFETLQMALNTVGSLALKCQLACCLEMKSSSKEY